MRLTPVILGNEENIECELRWTVVESRGEGSCGEPGGQLWRAGVSAQDVLGHECMLRCWFVEIYYKSFSHSNPL